MESSEFTGIVVNQAKERAAGSTRKKSNENRRFIENFDPNVCSPRRRLKLHDPPPVIDSGCIVRNLSSRKSDLNRLASPCAKENMRERRFVIAKKKCRTEESDSSAAPVDCDKCEKAAGKFKCLCVAYQSLRASHEEFFNNQNLGQNEVDFCRVIASEPERVEMERSDDENGELRLKRSRERVLEEARRSVPEQGSGRVMHLVKAFERLLMIRKSDYSDVIERKNEKKALKWALPGLQEVTRFPSSSSDFSLTSESLGLNSRISFLSDGGQGRSSAGGRKNRPSCSESSENLSRRQWKPNQPKAISRKPFMLLTEQRGRNKEENFRKKLQKKLVEEENLRMHVAQGLPNTTDETEIPTKPPVKERTKPIDLVLHSDARAAERAEFDNMVAKKVNLVEQYRMERGRQQRLDEEVEIRKLRKQLVPKAKPMPYFDRPFIPRRSMKDLTIPREPKFHLPQRKKMKCCMSLDELPARME